MKNIQSYDQFLLEKEDFLHRGLRKLKGFIGIKSIWKIKYTVTEYEDADDDAPRKKVNRHGNKPKEAPATTEKGDNIKRSYSMTLTIKATSENDAKSRFLSNFEKEVRNYPDPKPTVKVNSVQDADEMENTDIEIL